MAESVAPLPIHHYVCHECGNGLIETPKERYPLWCLSCRKPRKVPTHPALIVRRP